MTQPYQQYTLESIFEDAEPQSLPRIIWRTSGPRFAHPEDENLIQITEHGINIISCPDIRQNVRLSLLIAMDLAAGSNPVAKHGDHARRVLYLNSYASLQTLRRTIAEELMQRPKEKAEIAARFGIMAFSSGTMGRCTDAPRTAIFEDVLSLDNSEEVRRAQYRDVIVLNSFEFAAFTYYDKLQLAGALLEWREAVPLTIIIFTQEINPLLEAGWAVRGPLGLLSTSAHSINKLNRRAKKEDRVFNETNSKNKIKLFYTSGGVLDGVEYPKNYSGTRYPLDFFPHHLTGPIPDGIDAIQLVGRPPMNRRSNAEWRSEIGVEEKVYEEKW